MLESILVGHLLVHFETASVTIPYRLLIIYQDKLLFIYVYFQMKLVRLSINQLLESQN